MGQTDEPTGPLAWGSLHWEPSVMGHQRWVLWAVGANPRVVARKRSSRELTGVGGVALLKEVRAFLRRPGLCKGPEFATGCAPECWEGT